MSRSTPATIAKLGIVTDPINHTVTLPGVVELRLTDAGLVCTPDLLSNAQPKVEQHHKLRTILQAAFKAAGDPDARHKAYNLYAAWKRYLLANPLPGLAAAAKLCDVSLSDLAEKPVFLGRFSAVVPHINQAHADCPDLVPLFWRMELSKWAWPLSELPVDWSKVAPCDALAAWKQSLIRRGKLSDAGWRCLVTGVEQFAEVPATAADLFEYITLGIQAGIAPARITECANELLFFRTFTDGMPQAVSAIIAAALRTAHPAAELRDGLQLLSDYMSPMHEGEELGDEFPLRPDFAGEGNNLIPSKGATWAWFLRKQAAWHRRMQPVWDREAQIVEARRGQTEAAEAVGWDSAVAEFAVDDLSVVPLTCRADLASDGRAMQHCVSTYSRQCRSGKSRIFSIRRGDERLATFELARVAGAWVVQQVRGPHNAKVPARLTEIAQLTAEAYNTAVEKQLEAA